MLNSLYPAGPATTPGDLTAVTEAYKRRAWIAMAVLVGFALVYLTLWGWFGWTAYRLGLELSRRHINVSIMAGCLVSSLLLLFMSRALLAVKRGAPSEDLEVTAQEQPLLFEFLWRVADEVGAPRPHHVFLSPDVNAAVFYDVSFKNLLVPSHKNLVIGLGLVNALTLGEFKAVLAHEFGHFAQRSMAVGRWVYTAQQIANHLVHSRGIFDRMLRGLSRFDIRVAWVGWILRLIVWSMRSLLDTVFSLVVMAQRALSREMELQADLVAVSLTGSDAIVHALHRLRAADEAWSIAVPFAFGELSSGHRVADVFSLQTRVTEQMRVVLDDPDFGSPPALPERPESHRVFEDSIAQPPRMWMTHPPGREREENAKRRYVSAPVDQRSAWSVFADPESLRHKLTDRLLLSPEAKELPAASQIQESLQRLDAEYTRKGVDPRYRGVYLGRPLTREAQHADELYEPQSQADLAQLAALYPRSLAGELKTWRNLQEETAMLEALSRGDSESARRHHTPPRARGSEARARQRGRRREARRASRAVASVGPRQAVPLAAPRRSARAGPGLGGPSAGSALAVALRRARRGQPARCPWSLLEHVRLGHRRRQCQRAGAQETGRGRQRGARRALGAVRTA
ncbi:MAG: M48 family metallopeptidase [Myxococcales bacterium]